MKIQKLLHSCLLIEENGKRILIDPGSWTFSKNALAVSDIPQVNAIFITHSHGDHCEPQAIKKLIERDNCPLYANSDIAKFLEKHAIKTTVIGIPETVTVADFTVTSVVGPHEKLPVPIPLNNGFYVNHRLFHAGDSHSFEKSLIKTPEILALPILAPWGSITTAVEIALRLKPQHVIPIHDGFIKEEFLVRMHEVCKETLTPAGIKFHPLKPGEVLEI